MWQLNFKDLISFVRTETTTDFYSHNGQFALFSPSNPSSLSGLSRLLGISKGFHTRMISLLNLGYKCRLRLPLFISAGFFLCHFFSNYVPRVEINVQVVEEEDGEENDADEEAEGQTSDEEEYSHDDDGEESEVRTDESEDNNSNEPRQPSVRSREYEILGEITLH